MKKWNDFHLVDISPWPIITSFMLLNLVLSLYCMLHKSINILTIHFLVILTSFIFIFFLWTRDIVREASYLGFHSLKVKFSIKIGMVLFILSEVMFFLSFFWSFFNFSLNPAVELGNLWPPLGIEVINPYHIPLLNTLVLVSSGVSITFSHHNLLNNNMNNSMNWALITIILGIYFSFLQGFEYLYCSYSIMDSTFGSIFYMATGFHGLHVMVGTLFIYTETIRFTKFNYSAIQNLGFEVSCWYWHFVDVVWLFLYIFLYWWSF
uniref:Cytochrome c oxidase subunit 3 n=1 Tax=Liposcelis entomophila TaxID=550478 RepID=A0A096X721_9NEOP|nr:cytochrome c oxidase subunit III [Liposcelis entomophila]AHA47077.1 cytochrome c oxidase subunit III [Liposcelis entomophila]